MSDRPVVYVALGDSYTIGTGASSEAASLPQRLAARLAAASGRAVVVRNPAVNGYTTADLIREELPLLEREPAPDLVSVLIGANDVVQGATPAAYQAALTAIYDAVARRLATPTAALAVSIPDWSVTPAAAQFGRPPDIARRIEELNAIAAEEARARGFLVADVTQASRRDEPRWLAGDDLHPSDRQYEAWAATIWPTVGPAWTALATGAPAR